jgi:hypothetical protein
MMHIYIYIYDDVTIINIIFSTTKKQQRDPKQMPSIQNCPFISYLSQRVVFIKFRLSHGNLAAMGIYCFCSQLLTGLRFLRVTIRVLRKVRGPRDKVKGD